MRLVIFLLCIVSWPALCAEDASLITTQDVMATARVVAFLQQAQTALEKTDAEAGKEIQKAWKKGLQWLAGQGRMTGQRIVWDLPDADAVQAQAEIEADYIRAYRMTGQDAYLEMVPLAFENLWQSRVVFALTDGQSSAWPLGAETGVYRLGMKDGACGIGARLIAMAKVQDDPRIREALAGLARWLLHVGTKGLPSKNAQGSSYVLGWGAVVFDEQGRMVDRINLGIDPAATGTGAILFLLNVLPLLDEALPDDNNRAEEGETLSIQCQKAAEAGLDWLAGEVLRLFSKDRAEEDLLADLRVGMLLAETYAVTGRESAGLALLAVCRTLRRRHPKNPEEDARLLEAYLVFLYAAESFDHDADNTTLNLLSPYTKEFTDMIRKRVHVLEAALRSSPVENHTAARMGMLFLEAGQCLNNEALVRKGIAMAEHLSNTARMQEDGWYWTQMP